MLAVYSARLDVGLVKQLMCPFVRFGSKVKLVDGSRRSVEGGIVRSGDGIVGVSGGEITLSRAKRMARFL